MSAHHAAVCSEHKIALSIARKLLHSWHGLRHSVCPCCASLRAQNCIVKRYITAPAVCCGIEADSEAACSPCTVSYTAFCECVDGGAQDAEWHLTNETKDIYPDFVKMAESFSVPAKRVLRPEELRPAIRYAGLGLLFMHVTFQSCGLQLGLS